MRKGVEISYLKEIKAAKSLKVILLAVVTILAIWAPSTSLLSHQVNALHVSHIQDPSQVSTTPTARLVYGDREFIMSPFVSVQGGQLNKVQLPSLPGDNNASLTVQTGDPISFHFNKHPTKVDAFITDYDGDIPSLHPLTQTSPNTFQVSGPIGIWEIEVHAIFPKNQYVSFTTLANVKGNSFGTQSLGSTSCTQDKLKIAGVTDSNTNNSNILATGLNNGNDSNLSQTPTWSATGKGSWIQVDLGQQKAICNLDISFTNGDKVINFFTIQTSTDGVHYVYQGTGQNTGMVSGREQFNLQNSPITARFVKLVFQGNMQGDTYNIRQLTVNGS
jgi:F5/8 type C domain-containing protein